MPPSLQPYTVSILLQYLFPPGSATIPPHLLSRPLLQRHHFLQISPEDAQQYLSWPSNDQAEAISRLDSSRAADDAHYNIRYTADIESHYAHVHLPGQDGGVRLVFLWEEDGWKYHDLGLMPFPTSSTSSVTELDTAGYQQQHGLWGDHKTSEDDSEDDSYWNSYGTDDHDLDGQSASQTTEDNEDAYWAQYANVHGSGDSTHPSPPQTQRKLVKAVEDAPLLLSLDTFNPPTVQSRLSPPSPTSLAARLHDLSPRASYHSSYASSVADLQDLRIDNEISPIEDEEESEDSDETPSPPSGLASHPPAQVTPAPADRDSALKSGIHGLYNLWLVGQTGTQSDSEKKLAFLDLVKQAIELP